VNYLIEVPKITPSDFRIGSRHALGTDY